MLTQNDYRILFNYASAGRGVVLKPKCIDKFISGLPKPDMDIDGLI